MMRFNCNLFDLELSGCTIYVPYTGDSEEYHRMLCSICRIDELLYTRGCYYDVGCAISTGAVLFIY